MTKFTICDEKVVEPAANDNKFVHVPKKNTSSAPLGPLNDSIQKASEPATEGKREMADREEGCYDFGDIFRLPSSNEFVYIPRKPPLPPQIPEVESVVPEDEVSISNNKTPSSLASLYDNCSTPADIVSEWLKELDEPDEPIAHGLFDAGDRVAIVAQSKARKSFFVLQLAIAIATGTMFLERKMEKRRVIIFNHEVSRSKYKQRVRQMLKRIGISGDSLDGLVIVNLADISIAGNLLAAALSDAKRHNCTVAVIDPVYKCLGNENDQTEVKEAVRNMKEFSVNGITFIGVYHAAKGMIGDRQLIDRVSGSAVFVRDASALISLVVHATEKDHVVMDSSLRNYAPVDPVTIRFDNGAFIVTDIIPLEKTSRTREKRKIPTDAVDACFTSIPIPYKDMCTRIAQQCAVGINAAKELLADAVVRGITSPIKEGRNTLYAKREY